MHTAACCGTYGQHNDRPWANLPCIKDTSWICTLLFSQDTKNEEMVGIQKKQEELKLMWAITFSIKSTATQWHCLPKFIRMIPLNFQRDLEFNVRVWSPMIAALISNKKLKVWGFLMPITRSKGLLSRHLWVSCNEVFLWVSNYNSQK